MPSASALAALTRAKAVSTWSSRRKSPFHPMIAARSRRSPVPSGEQVSRISSFPAKTRTPAARSISKGGRVRPPAPWVTRATPAAAIASAAAAALRSVMSPRQKPWLIVTLPPRPSARVRAQISWTLKSPISPASCRWMSSPTPCRAAIAKMPSRGSRHPRESGGPGATAAAFPLWIPAFAGMTRRSGNLLRSHGSFLISLQGVDAADQIGALAHRRVEQIEDAGTAHDAALRKGDDLHAHKAAVPLARREHALELHKAAFEIDVDMGAQIRGAARHARLDQIAGAFLGGDRQVWQDPFVRLNAAHPGRSRHMRHPRQPHQGVVEVHVTIDEAG